MKINNGILFICLIFFVLETSCTKTDLSNIPLVSIDVSKGRSCYLDEIAENVECYNLTLPIDYYFGEIVDIGTYNDSLLLFHDYYTKQIHLFHSRGQ